jgi:hypothetical protein
MVTVVTGGRKSTLWGAIISSRAIAPLTQTSLRSQLVKRLVMASAPSQSTRTEILDLVSSLLTALRGDKDGSQAASRALSFESGVHVVRGRSRFLLNSIGEALDGAEARAKTHSGTLDMYHRLATDGPEPEVFVYEDKMAAVWTPYERLSVADDKVDARAYLIVLLLKPDDVHWKISGFAHTVPAELAPLPEVGKEMVPGIERLLDLPHVLIKERTLDCVPNYLIEGSRMVRYRVPGAPVGDFTEAFYQPIIASLPVGVQFEEELSDKVVRIADGMALLWMKFVTRVGGKPQSHGIDILILVEREEGWRIAGAHTYSLPSA